MGINPNDPNMMQGLLDSPQFVEQMARMMSDPSVVDQMIAANPSMAPMAAQIRQTFSSPQFQAMVSNPEALRAMIRMSSAMQEAGIGPSNPLTGAGFPGAGGQAGQIGTQEGEPAISKQIRIITKVQLRPGARCGDGRSRWDRREPLRWNGGP